MSLTWTSLYTNETLTRANFVTNLRTRIDADVEDSEILTDTQAIVWITAGLENISFFTGLLKEFAEETCDGSEYYDLPTDLVKLDEVTYIDSGGNNFYTLINTNMGEVSANGFSTATQKFYVRQGNRLYLYGTPTTGTIRIYGTRMPTTPSEDSSYIDLPAQYLELLYLFCEWKYWRRRREADEAALSRQLYFDMLERVRQDVDDELSHGASMYGKKLTRT